MLADDGPAVQSTFSIPLEFVCPLCLDLLRDAVATPCRHLFCRACIGRARGSGHNSCPLCRCDISSFDPAPAIPDAAVARLIADAIPQEVINYSLSQGLHFLEVVVGNLYEEAAHRGRNSNKWTMYVALHGVANRHLESLVDRVVYTLHETFIPRVVTMRAPHFSLQRYGWGTFSVGCEIHWVDSLRMPPMIVDHFLVFAGEGGRTTSTLDVDSAFLLSLCRDEALDVVATESQSISQPGPRRNMARISARQGEGRFRMPSAVEGRMVLLSQRMKELTVVADVIP